MLEPIRPRPIMPSCMVAPSLNDEDMDAHTRRSRARRSPGRTPHKPCQPLFTSHGNMDRSEHACQACGMTGRPCEDCSGPRWWIKTEETRRSTGWHSLRARGMLKNGSRAGALCLGLALSAWGGERFARAEEPRLNQVQVIGSHNSYHIAPHKTVLEMIAATGRRRAESIDYTHRPLAEQFSQQGIRQVELDVYADPKGGLFAAPSARKILLGLGKEPGPDPDANGQLNKPGLKVLHVPDVDFRSTAPTFVDALKQIRAWSQANRAMSPS